MICNSIEIRNVHFLDFLEDFTVDTTFKSYHNGTETFQPSTKKSEIRF